MKPDACIGVLLAELHFPESRSLKEKRAPLASLRDAIHARFRASFSEVGLQDTWQRARVLIVLAASSLENARERMDDLDRYLHSREFEVSRVLLKSTDPVDGLWDIDS
ncbi:MAG TPA: DUF503 domain-containing protein [Thermoleophilia bacterium]|nr:DUF503 domain-containing protein [Thermoleophilia bacterium]